MDGCFTHLKKLLILSVREQTLTNTNDFVSSIIFSVSVVNTPGCKKKCKKKKMEGDYQSCLGCNVYLTCDNTGRKFDNRPCAEMEEWDDNVKRCVPPGQSTTCITGNTRE